MLIATTYSLIVVTLSSFFGVTQRIRTKQIDYRVGIIFVIPSMLVAFSIRFWLMPLFPIQISYRTFEISRDLVITLLLVIVLFFTAIRMLTKSSDVIHKQNKKKGTISMYGLLTGILSGFIGAGGGFIIVPILMRIGLDMRKAVGTSMFIITIQSILALIGDFYNPEIRSLGIDWQLAALLSLLTIGGVYIGTKMQRKISSLWLRRIFALLLLCVAIGMINNLMNN